MSDPDGGDSGLRNNETIIRIRQTGKGRSLEKQLHILDTQIKVIPALFGTDAL